MFHLSAQQGGPSLALVDLGPPELREGGSRRSAKVDYIQFGTDVQTRIHFRPVGPKCLCRVIAKVSQETLAEMVGTTRSRVSHFMNKCKMGFIDYNGHLEIHSSLLNVVLNDQPHISGVNSVTGKPDLKAD